MSLVVGATLIQWSSLRTSTSSPRPFSRPTRTWSSGLHCDQFQEATALFGANTNMQWVIEHSACDTVSDRTLVCGTHNCFVKCISEVYADHFWVDFIWLYIYNFSSNGLSVNFLLQLGIFVVHFLDYAIGGSWWLMVLYLIEILVVFVVRGRPYSGETVVATLFSHSAGCLHTWAAPLLVFTWNVILPIALVVSCSTSRLVEMWPRWDWVALSENVAYCFGR
jgi:hypothetical protein